MVFFIHIIHINAVTNQDHCFRHDPRPVFPPRTKGPCLRRHDLGERYGCVTEAKVLFVTAAKVLVHDALAARYRAEWPLRFASRDGSKGLGS